jgi:hypothetical protein
MPGHVKERFEGYLFKGAHPPRFRSVAGPGANELQRLVKQIAARLAQVLERPGTAPCGASVAGDSVSGQQFHERLEPAAP